MPRIVELNCYPIKGCVGTSMRSAVLTAAGIAHDRSFAIIGPDGVCRTQREDPRLVLIRPEVGSDGARLTLHGPGADPLGVDVDVISARREVTMFGRPYRGIDQGDAAAGWLSTVLGAPSRLVRVPPEHDRVTDGETPGTSGYADSCPVHIVSRASLDLLGERIAERGGEPVPMDRFRANIVVAGWDEPHTEDRARRITVGGAELGFAKLAIRCVVTTVDQDHGVKDGPEPLRTLARYRRAEGGVAFGSKFAVLRPGALAVGDVMTVTAWAPAA